MSRPPPPLPDEQRLPPHPSRGLFRGYVVAGGIAFGLAGLALTEGVVGAAAAIVAFGAGSIWLGVRGMRVGPVTQILNTSHALISRRRYAEAEAMIARAEKTSKLPVVQRIASMQRGMIAMRRGDVEGAIALLDRAVAIEPEVLGRTMAEQQRLNARAMRAFLLATTGDAERARADIAFVASRPEATMDAHGYVAVAEAVLLERSGDRDGLRAHIAKNGAILFDVTGPRERAIVRAYQRMLTSPAASVYRKAAEPKREAGEEPDLAEWIAKVAPSAGPFLRPPPSSPGKVEPPAPVSSIPAPSPAARRAVQKRSGRGAALRVVLLWALLITLFFSIWEFLKPESGRTLSSPEPIMTPDLLGAWAFYAAAAVFGVFALAVVRAVVGANREAAKLAGAGVLRMRGDLEGAFVASTKLRESPRKLTQAAANLQLAQIAEQRGELEGALEACDAALACLAQPAMRAAASDLLYPEIVAERAFVLAALDRRDEAAAELAILAPPYPFLERALLRVRVLELVRRGDLERAAGLVRAASPDLHLSRRDELFFDVVCAAVLRTASAEIERVKSELRAYPEGRRWMDKVAPSALLAFERVESDPGDEHDDVDAEAEAELEAIADAERARGAVARMAR